MNLKARDLILISMFAALTAIGAFIKIPLPIVPFTLQYFFCAIGAILLGSKLGALSQILYVFVGLIGIPIFTQGGGPQYILQPTFGYLLGFILASFIIGKITENIKKLTLLKIFFSCLCGLAIIYIFGVSYMYIIYNFYLGNTMSVFLAIKIGVIAFLPSDILLSFIISIVGINVVAKLRKAGYEI